MSESFESEFLQVVRESLQNTREENMLFSHLRELGQYVSQAEC